MLIGSILSVDRLARRRESVSARGYYFEGSITCRGRDCREKVPCQHSRRCSSSCRPLPWRAAARSRRRAAPRCRDRSRRRTAHGDGLREDNVVALGVGDLVVADANVHDNGVHRTPPQLQEAGVVVGSCTSSPKEAVSSSFAVRASRPEEADCTITVFPARSARDSMPESARTMATMLLSM